MTELETLAELAGISTTYTDVWGHRHHVSAQTLSRLLSTFQLPREGEDIQKATLHLQREAGRSLRPVTVVDEKRKTRLSIPGLLSWSLCGDGHEPVNDDRARREEIVLPPLERGYYDLEAKLQDGQILKSRVIVAPPACWRPDRLAEKKLWGLAIQLYGLRSAQNMGIGDFGDLGVLIGKAAALGADLIGLNPPNALFLNNPAHYSPYSPSNRCFLNPLYIDVAAVEGFDADGAVQAAWNEPAFQQQLAAARDADFIDYAAVSHLKLTILQPLFAYFEAHGSHALFDEFCGKEGPALQSAAIFEALHEHFNHLERRVTFWRNWPEAYRRPDAPEVKDFARAHAGRVRFYLWLQWLADKQLARAQQLALSKGMGIGLYRDLAVGCDSNSAEAWLLDDLYLSGAAIGAPPDELNPGGQNWGLLAFDPVRIERQGLQSFIDLLRANMRHARALRIDHAFGLMRLFLIPQGEPAQNGAYVNYPFDELLAVLRLESHRNQCLLIGEDLGTSPPDFKKSAASSELFSYRVLFFEHDENGKCLPPDRYPRLSLATVSTHDLPTWIGWWKGSDLAAKDGLGIYATPEIRDRERADRDRDRPRLTAALTRENLGTGKDDAHRFLARSSAALCMLQLEDILSIEPQVNLPGTVDTYPNWRRRLPVGLESMFEAGGALEHTAGLVNEERAKNEARPPVATYRLQFHKGFAFRDAIAILPYLAELGITHVYASPWLKARPGSTHGYDITDHNVFNPELGGEDAYMEFCAEMSRCNLRQILDFVPNHMGVGGSDNLWWLSVLEWGHLSPFVNYFDINWHADSGDRTARLILPVLGDHYGDVLAAGELVARFDPGKGSIGVWYHDQLFPVCPTTFHTFLSDVSPATTFEQGEHLKVSLRDDSARHAAIRASLEVLTLDKAALHALLERQCYCLAFWRVASSEINYRRFFDIHDLAGLRMELPEVFEATHQLVFREIYANRLHGLRIDHVDGLADPEGYCQKLRGKVGSRFYLLVEKILGPYESLRPTWPIEGTTGYDELNKISGLLIDGHNEPSFNRIYSRFVGADDAFDALAARAKTEILDTVLLSELARLAHDLRRIAARSPYTRDFPLDLLQTALRQVIAWFPIYRTYVSRRRFTEEDRRAIEWAVGKARKETHLADISVYDFIASALSLEAMRDDPDLTAFVRRFQQLSGAAMAKGLEDTAFYRFPRLLALNEVGGHVSVFGIPPKIFQSTQQERHRRWPLAMTATATHDTKRGEDMRARLCALSGMPQEFSRFLSRAVRLNRLHYSAVDGVKVPSDNEEYFIYQTLLGSWPLELLSLPIDPGAMNDYSERIFAYLTKAFREAKVHTSWNNPREDYEGAIRSFLSAILDVNSAKGFLQEFIALVTPLVTRGLIASLSQAILKLTLPGVPDIYQGTELWDFSLVDPDNRRPVDYAKREAFLSQPPEFNTRPDQWHDGSIKQHLIHTLLKHRSRHPRLYELGDYRPLKLKGRSAGQFIAYSRNHEDRQLIVCVPVRFGPMQARQPVDLNLPLDRAPYRDVLHEGIVNRESAQLFRTGAVLTLFPYLVLERSSE